jgi:hypothetical protein
MRTLTKKSDMQIAYVHWGTEYELAHNAAQETLAHVLIDAGADAVIGHHPHVVQDVAFYKDKPIFYSLGNFIFDQYWDTDVQTGLGVRMTIDDGSIAYEAIPFTTAGSRVQPTIMQDADAHTLFTRIFGSGNTSSFVISEYVGRLLYRWCLFLYHRITTSMKITKYEAVGAFIGIGVMAVALFILRFDTTLLSKNGTIEQTAAVSGSESDLENRLTNAYAAGELSDLVIQDVRVGTGKAVEKGEPVEVQYEGRLQDGTRFDSSYARGESFTFKVGAGKVIEGWDKGIIGMQEGGERILVVPPRMGYGDQQYGAIPPKSPLVFMIELVDIK